MRLDEGGGAALLSEIRRVRVLRIGLVAVRNSIQNAVDAKLTNVYPPRINYKRRGGGQQHEREQVAWGVCTMYMPVATCTARQHLALQLAVGWYHHTYSLAGYVVVGYMLYGLSAAGVGCY